MATAGSAQTSNRFSADRLVGLEAFGSLRVSDDGRWVAVERQGAYDQAATYAYGPLTGAILSDLLVFDTSGKSPDRVIGADDTDGYQAGPISPDGRRMVVYRLTSEDRSLGVMTLETGIVKWFGVSPQLAVAGRTSAWRDDGTLIVIQTPGNALPLYYRLFRDTQDQVAARWRRAQDGRSATSTLIKSGPSRDDRLQIAPSRLVRLDVESGSVTTLLSGEVVDFELSPDGRVVAALLNGDDIQTNPDTPVTVGTPTRRRRLNLVDLSTGQVRDPAPDVDVLAYLLAWSPQGHRLLAYGRDDGRDWSEGQFIVMDADGTVRGLKPRSPADLSQTDDPGAVVARGGWAGDDPVLLVRRGPEGAAWTRLRRDGARDILPGDATAILGSNRDGVWLSGAGTFANIQSATRVEGRWVSTTSALDDGERGLFNPEAANLGARAVLTPRGCLRRMAQAPEPAFCPEPVRPGQSLTIASANGRTAVFSGRDDQGVGRISIVTADGATRTLVSINTPLATVVHGTIREIPASAGSTSEAPSWLLLPTGPVPAGGWPVIVRLYPGSVYPQAPTILKPGVLLTQLNPLVLADAGYAVLVPSLPQEAGQTNLAGLSAKLAAVVDRAASTGDIDPSRVGLMGHSYGGHAALLAATEGSRFQAVVASAGLADMATSLRDTVHAAANPADGIWINGAAGWLETGQGGLGKLPWADPAAYVAASPLYSADRIRTPVLIIQGDQDPVSAEAMFGALYRLNRDAALLTYWGEGHNLASPANIVDLHRRVIQFLDDHMRQRPTLQRTVDRLTATEGPGTRRR